MRPGEIGSDNRKSYSAIKVRAFEDVLLGRGNQIHLTRAKYHPEGRDVIIANPIIIDELIRFTLPPGVDDINDVTFDMYAKHIRSIRDEPMFLSQKKNGISVRQIETLFKNLAHRCNITEDKSHPHVLRHTHAIAFLKNTKDWESLRQNLGHKSYAAIKTYSEQIMDDAEKSYKGMYERIL